MILKSSKKFLSLLIIFLFFSPIQSEEKIDIWKNNKSKKEEIKSTDQKDTNSNKKLNFKIDINKNVNQTIKIDENLNDSERDRVFGVFDPEDYNFNLNMWSTTNADDVRASIKRLKKIKLSKTSSELLENVLLSFSYPPEGMEEKEFIQLKINWLIDNNKKDLIEEFLKLNDDFYGKSKVVQFLVDDSIAQANIKKGCEKIKFIDSNIKDSYLEKFKIYCLVFNNKKSQAQLLLDLLREQKQSDKFFDDKINFLLGISSQTSDKVNDKNLLNFYLSSVTIKNFNYEPNQRTSKEIWKYLNAANLITLEDITDKKKISELELAASLNQVDTEIIFGIYKKIPFDLNTLINAKNLFQTLDDIEARSLIYQKYLLAEDISSKLEYLFLL